MAFVPPFARRRTATLDVTRHALILIALIATLSVLSAESEDTAAAVVPVDALTLNLCRGKSSAEWAALVRGGDAAQLKPALEALLELCSAPEDLVPDLLKLIRENPAPDLARLEILTLGIAAADPRDVEPALLGILANPLEAPAKRASACRALIELSPDSIRVRKIMLAAAADRQPEVRHEAILALIVLAAPAPPNGFVPYNQNADDATDTSEPLDPKAGPAKEKSLGENKNDTRMTDLPRGKTARSTGTDAKSKSTPRAESTGFPYPPALDALSKAALTSRDAKDAASALRTLGEAGVEPLLRALAHGSPAARAEAAEALGTMARSVRRAFPALLQVARNETDRRVRDAIARAAANLNPRDPTVLDLLAENLGLSSTTTSPLQKCSIDDLLAGAGRAALPALRKALRGNSPAMRLAALKTLARVVGSGTESPSPVGWPPVQEFASAIRAFENADASGSSLDGAPALHSAVLPLAELIPDIASRVQDKDDAVRLFALSTLNRIGPPAADALDAIKKAANAAPADSATRRIATIAALNVSRPLDQPARITPLDARPRDELLALLASAPPPNQANTNAPRAHRDTRDTRDESDFAARLSALQTNDRADAALALRLHGGDPIVADALTVALADSDPRVRRAAARSLGACGPRATAAIPTLIQWLQSEPRSRAAALEAFAGLGADAKAAAHALAKAAVEDEWSDDFDDAPSENFKGSAARSAPNAAASPAAQFAASLNELFGLPDASELFSATPSSASRTTLMARALDPHASSVVPELCGYLRGGSPAVRARAAEALGSLGASAAEALNALVELSQSADDAEARAAFEALRRIGPEKNPRAVTYLAGVIRGSLYATRREWAVRALGLSRPGLDAGAFDGAAALIAALDDADETVCRAARRALRSIGTPILPDLTDAVLKTEVPRTNWTLFTLAEFKADAADVVPRLASVVFAADDPRQRAAAADLLLKYSPAHGSAVSALLKLLCSYDDEGARAAMRALKPLGREARPAIEHLLFDRDPSVRIRAAQALDYFQ